METLPLSEAKDQLSALVDAVQGTHETIMITRHGKPAAVLVSSDEFESLVETAYWAAHPDISAELVEARASIAAGERTSVAELRALLAEQRASA